MLARHSEKPRQNFRLEVACTRCDVLWAIFSRMFPPSSIFGLYQTQVFYTRLALLAVSSLLISCSVLRPETSVDFYQTARRCLQEDDTLQWGLIRTLSPKRGAGTFSIQFPFYIFNSNGLVMRYFSIKLNVFRTPLYLLHTVLLHNCLFKLFYYSFLNYCC
jgi:hypothetical protein